MNKRKRWFRVSFEISQPEAGNENAMISVVTKALHTIFEDHLRYDLENIEMAKIGNRIEYNDGQTLTRWDNITTGENNK